MNRDGDTRIIITFHKPIGGCAIFTRKKYMEKRTTIHKKKLCLEENLLFVRSPFSSDDSQNTIMYHVLYLPLYSMFHSM